MNAKVLVSACLLGEAVRHDGRHKLASHAILRRWVDEARVVPVCPEVAGGLPAPHLHLHVHPRRFDDGFLRVYPGEPPGSDLELRESIARRVRERL